MKVAFISTTNSPEISMLGDMALLLSQFVQHGNRYTKYWGHQKLNIYKILDNGAAEGQQVNDNTLISSAQVVNADEIIIPDTLYDGDGTYNRAKAFISTLSPVEKKQFKFMAVVQGKSKDEWMECWNKLKSIPEVDYIGLSKLSVPRCFEYDPSFNPNFPIMWSRLKCTSMMKDKYVVKKPLHLLGLDNPLELQYQNKHDFVRSNDSCLAISEALHDIKFDEEIGMVTKRHNDFNFFKIIPKMKLPLVYHNIRVTRDMARAVIY